MKKRIVTTLSLLLITLFWMPVTASAMLDKDASPPVVVSSGSFDSTYQTSMDFSISGGNLTGAEWTRNPMYVSYTVTGTCKEGESVSLSVTGHQTPNLANNTSVQLVFNQLTMKAAPLDGDGKTVGEEDRYTSGTVKAETVSHEMSCTAESGVKTVAITGAFVCRWAGAAVAEETVAVTVRLNVEDAAPAAAVPAESEAPSAGQQTPADPLKPEQQPDTQEPAAPAQEPVISPEDIQPGTPEGEGSPGSGQNDDSGSNPWGHAGPLATVLISILAVLAAALGGAAGSAFGGAAGAAGNSLGEAVADFPEEPESMVVQSSANGAQTLIVRDPATGGWIDAETGNPFDVNRNPDFLRQQRAALDAQRTRDAALEKAGLTAMQGIYENLRQEEAARDEAIQGEMRGDRRQVKFGTRDKTKAKERYDKGRDLESHMADVWRGVGDNLAIAEDVAAGIEAGVDTMVDGFGNMGGPAGKALRATYKVTKGVCKSMAEDGVSMNSFVSGAVRGGTEAGSDFIHGSPYLKAAVNAGGEIAAQGVSKGWDGVATGIVDGAVKAGLDALPDALSRGYGSDAKAMALKNGKMRVSWLTQAGKWAGKTTSPGAAIGFMNQKLKRGITNMAVKGTVTLLDKAVINPYITKPIKDHL